MNRTILIESKSINSITESCVRCNLRVICYYRFSSSWFSNWHITPNIKKSACRETSAIKFSRWFTPVARLPGANQFWKREGNEYREREGEFRRGEEAKRERWDRQGEIWQRESARGLKRACNAFVRGSPVRRGAIATICINAFLDHWPELLNIGSKYTQTSLLTCLMGNFRRNKRWAAGGRRVASYASRVCSFWTDQSRAKHQETDKATGLEKKGGSRDSSLTAVSRECLKKRARNGNKNATTRKTIEEKYPIRYSRDTAEYVHALNKKREIELFARKYPKSHYLVV